MPAGGFALLAGMAFYFGSCEKSSVRSNGMKARFYKVALGLAFFSFYVVGTGPAAAAQEKAANVSGKWQISWQARMGTERDIVDLQQSDSVLTGTFHGKFVTPKVSGSVDGNNITLRLDFPGQKPYSIVFTGTIDGDRVEGKRMSGIFEIPGVPGAYDFHGENISPSNYTWSATRAAEGAQSSSADGASKGQSRVEKAAIQ